MAIWMVVLLILPILVVLVYSFGELAEMGGYKARLYVCTICQPAGTLDCF